MCKDFLIIPKARNILENFPSTDTIQQLKPYINFAGNQIFTLAIIFKLSTHSKVLQLGFKPKTFWFKLKLFLIITNNYNIFFFIFRCHFHCCVPCADPQNQNRTMESKTYQNKSMKELLLKDERVSHTLKYKFAKFATPYCLGVIAQPVERRSLCNYTGIVIPTHHEFDPRAHPLMHHIFSQYARLKGRRRQTKSE